jgi:RNase adaptor protein for sRNA GlmZ degradation
MAELSEPIVVITGVSGYLGSQVALKYFKDATYTD